MAREAENQVNALGVLGTAIKTTPAAAKVDTNSVLFTLGSAMNWGFVPDGGVLEMQPVFNILTEKGASLAEAASVCLLLHRRSDRLGMTVKLPTQVENLSDDVRNDLIANLPKQGATGVTASPGGAAARQAAAAKQQGRSATGTGAGRDLSGVKLPGVKVKKDGLLQQLGISNGTLVLCALVIAAGTTVRVLMREKQPESVSMALPAGFTHLKVSRFEDAVFFYDPRDDFKLTEQQLQDMGDKLAPLVEGAGLKRAYLCLAVEPLHCRTPKAFLKGKKLIFINQRPPAPPPPSAGTE